MTGRGFDLHGRSFDLNEPVRKFSDWVSSGDEDCLSFKSGSSSVGRASAFQAEGRGFDPRFPLHCDKVILLTSLHHNAASLSLSLTGFSLFLAHVAQSVEHFLGKEEVIGSNPIVGSKERMGLSDFFER